MAPLFEELLQPGIAPSVPSLPKTYYVPKPSVVEVVSPQRGWGWLVLPVVLALLACFMAVVQRLREQQRELAASQLQLAETQQAFFALQMKPDPTQGLGQRLQDQSKQLAALQEKLQQAEVALQNSTDQASAREHELQKLVGFLKEEIKASEAQLAELKQLLKQRTEIKKPE